MLNDIAKGMSVISLVCATIVIVLISLRYTFLTMYPILGLTEAEVVVLYVGVFCTLFTVIDHIRVRMR